MLEKTYMREQLREALHVVDSCLECVYKGDTHMYRPLAAQLRLLLCDTQRRKDNSLIRAVYPQLKVSALRRIEWSPASAGLLQLEQPEEGSTRIAEMPFEITIYSDGLVVADLAVDNGRLSPIGDWCEQRLTVLPSRLTCRDVIRAVADKGGGAHVDPVMSTDLNFIRQQTPAGRSYGELFILGLGRFVQKIGEHLFQYTGARVPIHLLEDTHQKFNLISASHVDDTRH